jgi:S-adenosylmethionine:tRNA-ribosyltransferase-isomerase (queuine synthetase)
MYSENRADELKFTEELECLKEAQAINLNDTAVNQASLYGQLQKLGQVIDVAKRSDDREFVEAFQNFHREAA